MKPRKLPNTKRERFAMAAVMRKLRAGMHPKPKQYEVAAQSGVLREQISNLETGTKKRLCLYNDISRLARVYNIKPHQIVLMWEQEMER